MTSNNSIQVGVVNPKLLYQHATQLVLTRLRVHGWNMLLEKLMKSELDVYTLFGPFDLLCKHYRTADHDLPKLLLSYNIFEGMYSERTQFFAETIDKFEDFEIDWQKEVTTQLTPANLQYLDDIQRDWHSVPPDILQELISSGAIFPEPVTKKPLEMFPGIKAFVFIHLPVITDQELQTHKSLLEATIFKQWRNSIQGLFWSSSSDQYHCAVEISVPTLSELVKFVMVDLQGILPGRIESATHIAMYTLTAKQVPVSTFLRVPVEAIPVTQKVPRRSLGEVLAMPEGPTLEFKATFRYNLYTNRVDKALEKAVSKTVAAFMNTEGGTLVIGVADDRSTTGLEHDIGTLKRKDADGFIQALSRTFSDYLGTQFMLFIESFIERGDDKSVCIVYVDPSPEPVYLRDMITKRKEFYIRVGNTTPAPLDPEATTAFLRMHWRK